MSDSLFPHGGHRARVVLALAALPACLMQAPAAESATLLVPTGYSRITDALVAAGAGDTIQVDAGTYATSINGEAFPLLLNKTGLVLRGAGMDVTTLDAEQQAAVVRVESQDCRISGFTVTGGRSLEGGGIRIASGSAEIDHNLVIENEAQITGSGIFINTGGSTWTHHNVVWENIAIDVQLGDPHGIQFRGSGGLVEHNLVGWGDSNGLLINPQSNPVVRNNIFYENGIPTPLRGRGICSLTGAQPIIAYNLFFGNQIAALLVQGVGDLSAAEANAISPVDSIYGNLDADPEFIAPHAQDWHLRFNSPAIDAGDPVSPPDPDSTPADIGPFYFDQSISGVPDGGGAGAVLAVHPNPFLGSTTFTWVQEEPGAISLTVFDHRGRRVATVLNGRSGEGPHAARWNGRTDAGEQAPSGVYFVRLVTGERTRVGRAILLR